MQKASGERLTCKNNSMCWTCFSADSVTQKYQWLVLSRKFSKVCLRKYWEYCPPGISHFTLQLIWSGVKRVYLQRKSMTIQLRKCLVVIAEDSMAGLLGARTGWLSRAEPSGQRKACVWCCGEMMAKTNHSGDPTGDNWPGWSSCMKADVVKGKGEEAAVKTQGSRDLN